MTKTCWRQSAGPVRTWRNLPRSLSIANEMHRREYAVTSAATPIIAATTSATVTNAQATHGSHALPSRQYPAAHTLSRSSPHRAALRRGHARQVRQFRTAAAVVAAARTTCAGCRLPLPRPPRINSPLHSRLRTAALPRTPCSHEWRQESRSRPVDARPVPAPSLTTNSGRPPDQGAHPCSSPGGAAGSRWSGDAT